MNEIGAMNDYSYIHKRDKRDLNASGIITVSLIIWGAAALWNQIWFYYEIRDISI